MSIYQAAFGFGLVSLAVIAVGAVGFTMQFGITNLINLAYGDIMITSAFASYALNRNGINIWVALLAGAAVGAIFSFLLNRFVYGPFQRKGTPLIGMVIVSLAIGIMTSNLLLAFVGSDNVSYKQDPGDAVRFAGMILSREQLLLL